MTVSVPDQITAIIKYARGAERIRAAMQQTVHLVEAITDASEIAPDADPELRAALTAAGETGDALRRAFEFLTAKYDTTVAS